MAPLSSVLYNSIPESRGCNWPRIYENHFGIIHCLRIVCMQKMYVYVTKDLLINIFVTVYCLTATSIYICTHESFRDTWINLAEAYTVYCSCPIRQNLFSDLDIFEWSQFIPINIFILDIIYFYFLLNFLGLW